MVSYRLQLTSEDGEIAEFVSKAIAVARRYLDQQAFLQVFYIRKFESSSQFVRIIRPSARESNGIDDFDNGNYGIKLYP